MNLLTAFDAWSAQHPFWISALFVVISNLIFAPFNEEIRNSLYRRPGKHLFLIRRDATQATIDRLEKIAGSDRELLLDLLETGAFQLVFSLGMTLFSAGLMTGHLATLRLSPQFQIEAFMAFLILGSVSSLLLASFAVLMRCAQIRRIQESLRRLKIQKVKLDPKLRASALALK